MARSRPLGRHCPIRVQTSTLNKTGDSIRVYFLATGCHDPHTGAGFLACRQLPQTPAAASTRSPLWAWLPSIPRERAPAQRDRVKWGCYSMDVIYYHLGGGPDRKLWRWLRGMMRAIRWCVAGTTVDKVVDQCVEQHRAGVFW